MENLKVIENNLVPVYETSEGEKVVYGSELHGALGVKSNYRDWIRNRISDCDAVDGVDYEAAKILAPSGQHRVDHIILLDTAKEMAMLERNEKGKEVRRYFIEIEKKYKSKDTMSVDFVLNNPGLIIKLLTEYQEATEKVQELEEQNNLLKDENEVQSQQIAEMNPKATYYDIVLSCQNALTITEIAKDYGWSAKQMNTFLHKSEVQYKTKSGVWLLYQKYADKGYTKSDTVVTFNKNNIPTSRLHTKWTQKGRLFIYDLMKANGNLPLVEQE